MSSLHRVSNFSSITNLGLNEGKKTMSIIHSEVMLFPLSASELISFNFHGFIDEVS
jgi:hypothetical protein